MLIKSDLKYVYILVEVSFCIYNSSVKDNDSTYVT